MRKSSRRWWRRWHALSSQHQTSGQTPNSQTAGNGTKTVTGLLTVTVDSPHTANTQRAANKSFIPRLSLPNLGTSTNSRSQQRLFLVKRISASTRSEERRVGKE